MQGELIEVSSFGKPGVKAPAPQGQGAGKWDAARRADVLTRDFTVNGLLYKPR